MTPTFLDQSQSRDFTFELILRSLRTLCRMRSLRARKARLELMAPAALARFKDDPIPAERDLAVSIWKLCAAMGIDALLKEASDLYTQEPHASSHLACQ